MLFDIETKKLLIRRNSRLALKSVLMQVEVKYLTKVEVSRSLRESWFALSNRLEIFNGNIYLEVLFQ